MSDALSQMIDALGLEVAAIRQKGGGTQVELRGGEGAGRAGGSRLYRFIVGEDLSLRDDTPVRVVCGREDVPGVLVSFRNGVLVVALEKDLGPRIAAARLVANESFLVERLKERLEKVRAGDPQFSRQAADRVFGLAPVRQAEAPPRPAVFEGGGRLNDDQIRAVHRSLASDTTYVWGPPGTGKTTTLARIVEAHYRAGRSVLLVSNTNIAVDTALECVAERLHDEPDFDRGLVIRQGPVVKQELRRQFGSQVILEEIVARLGRALRREQDQLARAAAALEAEERPLAAALTDLEQLAQARRNLAGLEQGLAAARAGAGARERKGQQYRARAARLRADLERAHTMGAVRRFFSGLDPERLAHELAATGRAAQQAQDAARALAGEVARQAAELETVRAMVDRLATANRSHMPASRLRAKLGTLRTRLGQIRGRIAAIDRGLAAIEQEVLARCRILATTVYRTYLGKAAPRQFDVVVVDEASMLMPPLVYFASGLARRSVTVAGDFRQLPPIVVSDQPLAEQWLKRDVFQIAGIPEKMHRRQPMPYLVALGTQYRMREEICAVVNRLFYPDHPLRSDPSVGRADERLPRFPLGKSPLLYADTAPFHPWTAFRVGTYSRYNLFHALLVRNIVLHLAEAGFLPSGGEPNEDVGAIAPYAYQARLIQALLEDRLGARAAGVAATVHSFQGNQKTAMVLDLTDSLGAPLGRFLRAVGLEEDGARLLNVAASRARHHVVLVGNFEYLRARAPHGAIVRQLVDHFEEHGEALDPTVLLALAERDWVTGLHGVPPISFDFPESAAGAFTEGTFYPAFLEDLARARESVVIFSPFATNAGTGRWLDPLRAAIARGVRVRILTRPAGEPGRGTTGEVGEPVAALRDLGAAVDLRARMHEKIAILDGRILWHGSLNVLSHRDTHESMLRIESPAACTQLARFVSAPAGPRPAALPAAENPECPRCGGTTVWNDGPDGIYFECGDPDCDGMVEARRGGRPRAEGGRGRGQRREHGPAPISGRPAVSTDRTCPKPGCGGRLIERNGRHGRFLGCTNYPGCHYTEIIG
ncbi:MAG TPA: AAA domain-containing protein [Thermoanaerobaculia bacterium]|nr:AAA domain-containing protein [Thermoanaerobaculia bacterium]